jgi:hypothetical protein
MTTPWRLPVISNRKVQTGRNLLLREEIVLIPVGAICCKITCSGLALSGKEADRQEARHFMEGLESTGGRLACLMDKAALAVDARQNCEIEYPL